MSELFEDANSNIDVSSDNESISTGMGLGRSGTLIGRWSRGDIDVLEVFR
jgi:hypothetical protein